MRRLIDPARPLRHSLVPALPRGRLRRLGIVCFLCVLALLIGSARYLRNRVHPTSFDVRILRVR